MPVQPIDLQLIMSRAVENNQNVMQNQRYDAQQQSFNQEFQQQIERNATQISGTEKTEEMEIRDGQSRNKGKYQGSRKKGQKKTEEKQQVKKNKSTSLFDVSI